jgi:hypothetical protein
MARQTEQPSSEFAEGVPVPTPAPAGSVEAVRAQAPTKADYAREHRTYRALTDLTVGHSLAVTTGGAVPASHPYLRDTDERGPGWVSQGAVELTGEYDAPEDLQAAHEAYKTAQAAKSAPGAGRFPGA